MIPSFHVALIVAWGAAATLLAAYVASVTQEITYVTLADGRKAERRLPILFRLLLPLAANFRGITHAKRTATQRAQLTRQIASAGLEGLLSAEEFLALKFLVPLVMGSLWVVFVLLVGAMMPDSFIAANRLPLALLGLAFGYVYPITWLRRTLRRRHLQIFKALPFVLDTLTLSVEAGMDFMNTLQRNCARQRIDPLNEELIRMTHEIQVGVSRRVALQNLARRVDQPDLRGVAYALVQADELGVSVGSILRIQSEQMRGRRFDRAEKLALEAPVKMLGPLLLCIFPAVFIILLGPILTQVAANLF